MAFVALNVFVAGNEEIALPGRLLLFEKGTNVVNLWVSGDLNELLTDIVAAGGRVVSCAELDRFEPVEPGSLSSLLMEGV